MNVIDVESQADTSVPPLQKKNHAFLHEMVADYKAISKRRVREVYHDATYAKERAQDLFSSGVLTLRERALAEQIYIATIIAVARIAQLDREEYSDILEDLEAITDELASKGMETPRLVLTLSGGRGARDPALCE